MNIFVNFVLLLLLISFVESAKHIKSIKLSKNVIYDCMDIYKQPSLLHPLLKHHNVQMKPSGWDSQLENRLVNKRHKKRIHCPSGTVPILRTKNKNVLYSQEYSKNHFNFLTAQYPGTHIAGVRTEGKNIYRGVGARISTYDLSIGKDQSSSAHTYVATQSNDDSNSIQVGWMINERLFGNKQPWSYGSWLGKHGSGCFNVQCPGFIQVNKENPISEPLSNVQDPLSFSIHQDKETKNWWLTNIKPFGIRIVVGYWPNELFNVLRDGADFVGYGGIVTSDPRGPSPPMGNGRLPNIDDRLWSGSIDHLNIIDSNYTIVGANDIKSVPLVDSNKCYDVYYRGYVDDDVGVSLSYGGPGGFKCGY
ncbi:uncharacterized protein LOC17880777 [Capsella rubella]|uniref:uncharacterized protein LOC17880777 n=1 Tax=Capsella rubella TaxID=81985 RepID=UPI000CD5955A|nr:uncharacterized protein LOC17880777 [Capsella rubella]